MYDVVVKKFTFANSSSDELSYCCCKTVQEVVFIFCIYLIQVVTIMIQWK